MPKPCNGFRNTKGTFMSNYHACGVTLTDLQMNNRTTPRATYIIRGFSLASATYIIKGLSLVSYIDSGSSLVVTCYHGALE
ncbi:hypothetical protein TorRG33x02_185610 [Trema orientale]|uniref:Uncharacterized protein n=1 Tax=Trema orientale TaxID=63057 RepID=A0A2P5EJJ3_TREOI|nr:hypothetical protein TorRG33x02_185610 [Trema orientale]